MYFSSFIRRRKLGSNNNFLTRLFDIEKLLSLETSFVLIMEPKDIELFTIVLMYQERDFDVMEETLGNSYEKKNYYTSQSLII